jgi:hypothetical protein
MKLIISVNKERGGCENVGNIPKSVYFSVNYYVTMIDI